MLQQDKAEDFVIATGVTTTVRNFVSLAFLEAGIELEFKGSGVNEVGIVKGCRGECKLPIGKEVVAVDAKYFRPTEVELLLGDPTKAKTKIGWKPIVTLDKGLELTIESYFVKNANKTN
jgi:GDPmannose 4,6-dehydratase